MNTKPDKRIVLLASSVYNKHGGIQTYMRLLIESLQKFDKLRAVISYQDSSTDHSRHNLIGSDSSKLKLLQNILEFDWNKSFLLIGHLSLSPIGWYLKSVTGQISGYGIILHGREAWAPKPYWNQYTLAASDLIISTTNYTRRRFLRANELAKESHEVLPLALPPARFDLPEDTSDRKDNATSTLNVLTVSRLTSECSYKGVDDVIRAVAMLSKTDHSIAYRIAGDGDDRPRLERLARDLAVEECIQFDGSISDDELFARFTEADVFAMPSSGEGFGLVFLEAMSFGLPIIASPEKGANYVVRDGENGLSVPSNSPESVFEALKKLTDETYRRKLAAGAKKDFKERFSFSRFRKDLHSILTKSVDSKSLHNKVLQ